MKNTTPTYRNELVLMIMVCRISALVDFVGVNTLGQVPRNFHFQRCAFAFVEPQAIGTHVAPQKSANPVARKVIVTVKKVVEYIRKSSRAKVNAAVCFGVELPC